VVVLIEDLLLAYIIIILHVRNDVEIYNTFFVCMAIAVLSAVFALFFPSVKIFIENYLSAPQVFGDGTYLDHRGFGIGNEKTFSYSIIIALLYGYLLFFSKSFAVTNLLYLLFPIVSLSILINARTGMLVLIIGLVLHLIINSKVKLSKLIFFTVLFFLLFIEIKNKHFLNYQTEKFVYGFFYEMSDVLLDTNYADVSTVDALVYNYRVLPTSISEWLIGKGVNMSEHGIINHVDSGYVTQIVYGGIIYLFIIFMIIVLPIIKITYPKYRLFILFLLIASIIVNFKAPFVPMALGFKTVSLMMISCLFYDHFQIKSDKINIGNNGRE